MGLIAVSCHACELFLDQRVASGLLGSVSNLILCFYSSAGISGKSQVLFALVFTTRYLDLFTVFISAYNSVMKVRM